MKAMTRRTITRVAALSLISGFLLMAATLPVWLFGGEWRRAFGIGVVVVLVSTFAVLVLGITEAWSMRHRKAPDA